MKKIIITFALCLILAAGPALAHHPAEDMVDSDIYDTISEAVADTPHAEMDFDDMEETTIITTDSVTAAEDLIDDGFLDTLSLLEEDITVTITFGAETLTESNYTDGPNAKKWVDWGREVVITVNTLLKVPE